MDFPMLEFLHKHNITWCDWQVSSNAILCGRLDILKYIYECGYPWNQTADIIECGGPWDEQSCLDAIESGHLEILKYLCEHGCPWDKSACREKAIQHHRHEILEWMDATCE